jgi:hypothetical protein
MHATQLLDKTIRPGCQSIHGARYKTLVLATEAAQLSERLSVTGLGRAVPGLDEKMGVKRMDRLAGNEKLATEIPLVYGTMAGWAIGATPQPVIAVDWTPLKPDNSLHALRASLVSSGRGLTLYEEVHPESELGGRAVQTAFLYVLERLLPPGCRPVLVTDGGFKNPWFRAVQEKEWDFVGRIRGTTQLTRPGEDDWVRCSSLGALLESDKECHLGSILLARTNPLRCTLYGLRKPPKGRQHKTLRGTKAMSKCSRTNAAREREPWLLVTSLEGGRAITRRVIEAYRKRMQIEEAFRDTKNQRYGLGLNLSLSRSAERYAVLLLIGALALFVAWVLGKAAHAKEFHRRYQANTVTSRMVLSFVFLGRRIARRGELEITDEDLLDAQNFLRSASSF